MYRSRWSKQESPCFSCGECQTVSPTYSICEDHGYIKGEEHICPICGKPTEIWSRITGYYRPVQNWNDGKQQEFRDRKEYQIATRVDETADKKEDNKAENKKMEPADGDKPVTADMNGKEVLLFTTMTCPNCKIVKRLLTDKDINYKEVDAAKNFDLVEEYDIMTAPTLVITDGEHVDKLAGIVEIQKRL